MYRIEVTPGEETVFRTMEELAVAIRNGLVTPRARIYHNASQKWLPIGLHPHYKKAMELPAVSAAHAPTPTPVPVPSRSKPRVDPPPFEHRPEPKPAPAPRVPAPRVSPVVAMQQEVLRDLPVVVIPEPLPWATRPLSAESIAPEPEPVVPTAQAVQSQPTATVTYTPSPEPESVQPEPVSPWPHFEPVVEEAHARPTARRSKRARGRPLLLVGIAAALVAAAHFTVTATHSITADTSDRAEPEAEPEEELVSEPVGADASPEEPAVKVTPPPGAAATPRVTSAPARVRMTPGPAFAASAPVLPGADTIAPRAKAPVAPATPTKAEPAETASSIAPAPVELDLALPDLRTDSIATGRRSDTTAMKKILRALNGSKP